MILLYTGAIVPNTPSNSTQSIGGFISNTVVINSQLHNLFSSFSRSSLRTPVEEYRLIALKNTTTSTITSISIWTENLSDWFDIELCAISPAFDQQCNKFYFEQLSSPFQAPFQGTFHSYEGEVNKLVITTPFPTESFIGIWVKRKFKQNKLEQFNTTGVNNQSCTEESIQELQTIIDSLNSEEEFNLIIDFS